MQVTVKWFGPLREATGTKELGVRLPAGSRVGDLAALLAREHPAFAALAPKLRAAVNQEVAEADAPLADGDEVAFLPPVAGGTQPRCTLEDRPLDVGQVVARVVGPDAGGIVTFVGTVRDAPGLRFAAVRVIGLAEGQLPPLAREDPVLPDALRATLAAPVTTAADDALEALHALDLVVRDAGGSVALSAPRLDVDRTQREPSAVVLEAAAALARPNAVTGEHERDIPDSTALRRDAFLPAHRAALEFRRSTPLAESAWQEAVAAGALLVPRRWRGSPAVDLDRVRALREATGQ